MEGSESLAANYTQEPKLALVVRGVYALAHALHDMVREACGAARGEGPCAAVLPFNVSRYRQHLARVRFRAPDGGLVAFDDNGDPPPESVLLASYYSKLPQHIAPVPIYMNSNMSLPISICVKLRDLTLILS